MEAISWRVRIGVVVAAYVSVVGVAAALVFARYRMYARHPEDVQASGGMYAAGDWMLAMFIASLLLAATILLIVAIRNAEGAYTRLAKILFGVSLTAPACLGLLSIPAVGRSNSIFAFACMYRVSTAPIFIFGFVISRIAARFKIAKRWTSYAAAVEALTLVVGITGIFLAGR
jgi:hypothetical protein